MNKALLNTEVQIFINKNLKTLITDLILKGSPFSNVTIQEIAEQIESKKKCQKKLPNWFQLKNAYFPNKLNIAQTSSEKTAKYKSELINGDLLADLTGGFGVDTFYFSTNFKKVIYCEQNKNLAKITEHNFKLFGLKNVEIKSENGIHFLKNTTSKLDWIYIDPSRRDLSKNKVFLLQDCEPDVITHLDLFFKKTNNVLLKLSPLLDIKNTIEQLKFVNEIHVVSVKNEVKELLFILKKNQNNNIQIKTINILSNKNQTFNFNYNKTTKATYSLPKKYLYEPNVAILKSGGFQEVSSHFKLDKIHFHSHLYTSDTQIDFPGRIFKILKSIPYQLKILKKEIPINKANITVRNFPETVAQIRKKTKIKDGGSLYLFFTTDINNNHIVLITEKVSLN